MSGKQILLKMIRYICLKFVYDLRNEFLAKFYYGLIGYTLPWVQQNLRDDLKCVLSFPELSRTFGPAKLVAGPDLRCLCPAGPAVWEPLLAVRETKNCESLNLFTEHDIVLL